MQLHNLKILHYEALFDSKNIKFRLYTTYLTNDVTQITIYEYR